MFGALISLLYKYYIEFQVLHKIEVEKNIRYTRNNLNYFSYSTSLILLQKVYFTYILIRIYMCVCLCMFSILEKIGDFINLFILKNSEIFRYYFLLTTN